MCQIINNGINTDLIAVSNDFRHPLTSGMSFFDFCSDLDDILIFIQLLEPLVAMTMQDMQLNFITLQSFFLYLLKQDLNNKM